MRLRMLLIVLAAVTAVSIPSMATAAVVQDLGVLSHDIGDPEDDNFNPILFEGNPTFYQLAGQSAFIQSRATSGTSGGQLDGATGLGEILFVEAFPEPLLTDYLTYSYIGILNLMGTDTNNDPVLINQSIVIGYNPNALTSGLGVRVEDLFPYTEADLVSAFVTQVDSPQFLDMAFTRVGGQPDTSAETKLLTQTIDLTLPFQTPPVDVELGQELTLVAFVGGLDGDLGVDIGRLEFGINRQTTIIPEPASFALLVLGGLALLRSRR